MFDRNGDLQLIRKCKRGHEPSFAKLLERYRSPVYGLCYRMTRNAEDARDLAQEVFIKVFSLLDRYDETYAFSSWLFRIGLPPHYRIITLLRHDQQLSYEEIATVLGLPLGTVKARIHRARNLILQALHDRSYDI